MTHRGEKALHASRACRRHRAGREARCRPPRARQAAARGWKYSSIRVAAPCPRRGASASARANPLLARGARFGEELFQSGAVAGLKEFLNRTELARIRLQFIQQAVAVGDADISPHLGVARRDAGEIAEAAGGKGKELRRVLAP